MILESLDINKLEEKYKDGINNILRTRMIKSLGGEVLILSKENKVLDIKKFDTINYSKELSDGNIVYLPFVSGFDGLVRTVLGNEFDIDEGIEPDWVEGVGYIPMGERMIEIGDLTPSYNNLAGFILSQKEQGFSILYAEYIKNTDTVKILENVGVLESEIQDFLKQCSK